MPHYPNITTPRRLEAITAGIGYNVASPYTVSIGLIPSGAVILGCLVNVATAFSQTALSVGSEATTYANLFGTADIAETVKGTYMIGTYTALAADTTYYAKFTDAGTSSAGYAYVTILYQV